MNKNLLFCLTVISVSLLSACKNNDSSSDNNAKLTVGGVIEGDCIRIGVPFAGKVLSVRAKEGANVSKDEELIHLDESQLNKQMKWTEKLIQAATLEKSRTKVLLDQLQIALKQSFSQSASEPSTKAINLASLSVQTDSAFLNESKARSDAPAKTDNAANQATVKELDEAQDFQLNLIAEAERSMKSTVDSAYNQQMSLLKEARRQAQKENTENKFFGLNAAHKVKEKAIAGVFDAKEQALHSSCDAQKQAIDEVIRDKQAALKETFKTKKFALQEMQAGRDSIASQINQEKKQIEAAMLSQQRRLSSIISNLSVREQAALKKLTVIDKSSKQKMIAMQIDQAQARLAFIETELTKAQAMQDEIASKLQMCSIKSPLSGTCVSRSVQPGELVAPGPTLVKVLDHQSLYARAFVSEADLSAVKIGQIADLHFDGQPAKTISAKVVAIDSQPCFSPERLHSKEDRNKVAYGIKLSFQDQDGSTKPGMPVDVNLFLSGRPK